MTSASTPSSRRRVWVDLGQRHCDDRDPRVGRVRRRERPVSRLALAATVDGQRPVDRQPRGKRGPSRHRLAVADDDRAEHLPGVVATLAVGPRRQAHGRVAVRRPGASADGLTVVAAVAVPVEKAARHPASVERLAERPGGGRQLLVDALQQERPLLGVRDAAEQQQAGRGERQEPGEQPRAQRPHQVRGRRSA
jgi:hypothetical protein